MLIVQLERSVLVHAISVDSLRMLGLLLDRLSVEDPFFIDSTDWNGESPLFHAVRAGNMKITKVLLHNGANARLKNNVGACFGVVLM